MAKYKNYLRKDPFSPFSQLNIDPKFYKNLLVPIIKSFTVPGQDKRIKHSSEEFSITMFLNALLGYSPNTGTQIMERRLNSQLKHQDRSGNGVKFARWNPGSDDWPSTCGTDSR